MGAVHVPDRQVRVRFAIVVVAVVVESRVVVRGKGVREDFLHLRGDFSRLGDVVGAEIQDVLYSPHSFIENQMKVIQCVIISTVILGLSSDSQCTFYCHTSSSHCGST